MVKDGYRLQGENNMFNKIFTTKKEPIKRENQGYIKVDLLIAEMTRALNTDCDIEGIDFKNDVFNAFFRDFIRERRTKQKEVLLATNTSMDLITRMDKLRNISLNAYRQSESTNNIYAHSQELTASIADIDNLTVSVEKMIVETKQISSDGVDRTNEVLEFIRESCENTYTLREQINKVDEHAKHINAILSLVKSISDQTKLLALNATIEAARAGESGKGFNVVANEVKTLSENTQSAILEVEESISSLQASVATSLEGIMSSANQLDRGTKLINEAVEAIKSMSYKIDAINASIKGVTDKTREQSHSTEILMNSLTPILQGVEQIEEDSKITSQDIHSLGNNVQVLRGELVNQAVELDKNDKIEIFKVDHLIWKWKIYNMILGIEKVDEKQASNYTACRLGKWYYDENNDLKHNAQFKKIEEPHKHLHSMAKQAVDYYNQGELAKAEESLVKMEEISQEIIRLLDSLK